MKKKCRKFQSFIAKHDACHQINLLYMSKCNLPVIDHYYIRSSSSSGIIVHMRINLHADKFILSSENYDKMSRSGDKMMHFMKHLKDVKHFIFLELG